MTTAPFVAGSTTSAAAAQSVAAALPKLQREVLDHIRQCGAHGCTTDEAEVALAGRHQTISPRVVELRRADLIIVTDRTRPTRSGRKAAVHVAREHATPDELDECPFPP